MLIFWQALFGINVNSLWKNGSNLSLYKNVRVNHQFCLYEKWGENKGSPKNVPLQLFSPILMYCDVPDAKWWKMSGQTLILGDSLKFYSILNFCYIEPLFDHIWAYLSPKPQDCHFWTIFFCIFEILTMKPIFPEKISSNGYTGKKLVGGGDKIIPPPPE